MAFRNTQPGTALQKRRIHQSDHGSANLPGPIILSNHKILMLLALGLLAVVFAVRAEAKDEVKVANASPTNSSSSTLWLAAHS